MNIGASIENHINKFDAMFWHNYNIPKQTAAQSLILKELQN